jgi:23S rRNA (cytosine1962-C5)-methyltransferase
MFTNQGGFALNAAFVGAKNVLGIDSSKDAIEAALINAKLNGFGNTDFIEADVFDFLELEIVKESVWDIVVLDPPAFSKSKKTIATAKKGYARLNKLAMKLIPTGGFLVTASCSQSLDENEFFDLINTEAVKQGKRIRLVFRGMQSPDHPIYAPMPETKYLKFFVFQLI